MNLPHTIDNKLTGLLKISTSQKPSSELLLDYINYAKRISNYENGFISFVDKQHYEIIESSTIDNKLKKGDVFQLCQTLCQEVIDKEESVFHCSLKGTKHYELTGRAFLETESVIGFPLFIDNKVWGTFTLCSINEKTKNSYKENESILNLIALKISSIIYKKEIKEKIKTRENLLSLGEVFLKTATYKRNVHSRHIECTDSFLELYDIDNVDEFSLGKKAYNRVHIDDLYIVDEILNSPKTDNVKPFEYRIVTKSKEIKWLSHKIKYIKDNNYILGVVQDITEQKKLEIELQTKNAELEQFTYIASHDLQEPLRTITSFSNLFKKKYHNQIDKSSDKYLDFISQAAVRMSDLVKSLLDYSRIGRKKEKNDFDCNLIVNSVLEDLSNSIAKKNAQFEIGKLPNINGYETDIRILFQNLISNAIKFNDSNPPKIDVKAKESNNYWEFSVIDNGIGIEQKYLNKIFLIFQRLHKKEDYDGTGIGLAHCKKIIELHDGNISVNSKIGHGTIFTFTLKK